MTTSQPKAPRDVAAEIINESRAELSRITKRPDGSLREFTAGEAIAYHQVLALHAVATSLLAVADRLHPGPTDRKAQTP